MNTDIAAPAGHRPTKGPGGSLRRPAHQGTGRDGEVRLGRLEKGHDSAGAGDDVCWPISGTGQLPCEAVPACAPSAERTRRPRRATTASGPEFVGGFGKPGISRGQLVDPLGRHSQDFRCLGSRDQRRECRPFILGIEYVMADSLQSHNRPSRHPDLGRQARDKGPARVRRRSGLLGLHTDRGAPGTVARGDDSIVRGQQVHQSVPRSVQPRLAVQALGRTSGQMDAEPVHVLTSSPVANDHPCAGYRPASY